MWYTLWGVCAARSGWGPGLVLDSADTLEMYELGIGECTVPRWQRSAGLISPPGGYPETRPCR